MCEKNRSVSLHSAHALQILGARVEVFDVKGYTFQ